MEGQNSIAFYSYGAKNQQAFKEAGQSDPALFLPLCLRKKSPLILSPFDGAFFCFGKCGNNRKMRRRNIFIEMQSQVEGLDFQLTKAPKKVDKKVGLPGDALLMKVHTSKAIEGKYIFMLTFGINVAPGLLANWLYEKINGRATKLWMDRIEVQINKSEIEKIITEIIGNKTN